MAIAFSLAGTFSGVVGGPTVLSNPTSLQFGPDGRLYVSEQNGDINAFTIALQDGQYVATTHELLTLPGGGGVVKSLQNHNDDGSLATSGNRQVTGLVVTGTAENPVLYISSSDPRISSNNDVGLDTNSGVITRVSWTGTVWETVDIVRGLPRSEENHANNGLAIHPQDPTKLYVMVGGNTNNGAPSSFFSHTGEYALSGTLLEIDLADIESRPILTDPDGGQNGQPRQYVYNLPTLDDPNVANVTDGVGEDASGMDEAGPWGGNDGLNMAILPADAPLRVYADGFRNAYDIAFTSDGRLYTVDNGSNGGLGANPNTETGDADGDGIPGEAINTPNNGGTGDPEPLFLILEGGNYGHPAPVRANQNQSWTAYGNTGAPDTTLAQNTVADISDRVPTGVAIAPGFVIDPSRFATGPGQTLADLNEAEATARLFESGVRVKRDGPDTKAIVNVGSSTNGIVVYDSGGLAFDGVLDGKLFVTQFNDNVTLLNLNAAGTGLAPVPTEGPDGVFGTADDGVEDADGVFFVANNSLGVPLGNPLDVTQGPNGTLWVAEIGTNKITVLAPSDVVLPGDSDSDNDGIENALDPFLRDASNGTGVVVAPGAATVWEFSQGADASTPGPDGFGGGLTGHMIDGTTDFEAFLQSASPRAGQNIQLDNVKFVTAAGGGTTVVEEVSSGDAFLGLNSGQFLFHTGFALAQNVGSFTVTWVVKNPGALTGGSDMSDSFQQIGGYIGDGTQANFLKIVAMVTNDAGTTAVIQIQLENGDALSQVINIGANAIFDNAVLAPDSDIVFSLTIDPAAATASPKATYFTNSGPVEVTTPQTIDLAGSAVLDTILGNGSVQGQPMGIAAGLFSTSIGSAADTFQAVFDSITVTATEKPVAPQAGDDAVRTAVGQALAIPVAQLLANDTDANPGDALTVTGVANAVNGTVALAGGIVTFTPAAGFEGAASFDYTVSDGALTDTATVEVTVADRVVLYRVNAGGPAVAATDGGPDWGADNNPDSPFLAVKGSDSTAGFNVLPGAGLPQGVPAAIFQTERWDSAAAPAMQWAFAVDPGLYEVSLFMGNGFSLTATPGSRVFDVAVEGAVPAALNDIDLAQRFGHLTGGVVTTEVEVTDGTLDIAFLHGVENPLINGIEIARAGASAPGAATLTINDGSNDIEISSFGNTAFTVTNTGGKAISFIEIDATDALLPDAVFDPFGLAGDTVAKIVTLAGGSDGGTGLVVPPGGFGTGAIGITYLGAGGTAGYEKIRLDFTDFDPGESISFGVDMDPNSIAGAQKTTLDSGAPLAGAGLWDVGGIGGAELSGAQFTVGYADGAVSEGRLMGQGTDAQMGASALATDRGEALAITLTVEGLAPGAEGTYGPDGPQILISGPEGSVARVLLAKGFIVPFTNPFTNAYAQTLDAQLRALEATGFPANNLVEMQYRDVTLTGAVQDISGLFDVSQVAAFDLSVPDQTNAYGVLAEDKLALGVVAGIMDPVTDLPRGPVTSPIHLTYAGPEADLSLAHAVSDATPAFGQSVTFTLTLANAGPDTAADVDVRALLPSGFAFEAASGPGSYDAATGLWSVEALASGAEAVLTLAATVLAPEDTPETVLHRINVGGPALAAPDGSQGWTADTSGAPSPFRVSGTNFTYSGNAGSAHAGPIVTDDASVPAYAPAALYNTERFDFAGGAAMVWSFPIAADTEVEVRLHFAELYAPVDLAGERVFDVALEGVVPAAFDDIDQIADAGPKGAFMRSAVTTVSADGLLDVAFLHVKENPALKGIEIVLPAVPGAPLDHVAVAEIVASSLPDPDSTPGNADPVEDDQASVTVTPGAQAAAQASALAQDTFQFRAFAEDAATGGADPDAQSDLPPSHAEAGVENGAGMDLPYSDAPPPVDWTDDWPLI